MTEFTDGYDPIDGEDGPEILDPPVTHPDEPPPQPNRAGLDPDNDGWHAPGS